MAIAEVQNANGTSSATLSATGAGNLLVAFTTTLSKTTATRATATGATFHDATNFGTPPGIEVTSNTAAHMLWVGYAYNVSSGITSVSASGADGIIVYEFSGVGTLPTNFNESDSGQSSGVTTGTTYTPGISLSGALSGDFGFAAYASITSGGVAGGSVSSFTDANSNTWSNLVNVAPVPRMAAEWSALTHSIGSVTVNIASGSNSKCLIVFSLTPGNASTVIPLLACCGAGAQ